MPTQQASDDFNRADSASLGGNWTDIDSGMRITSNEATPPSTNNVYSSRYTAVSAPADQYAEIDVGANVSTATDEGSGPSIRMNAGGNIYLLQGNNSETRQYKRVGGGYTQLGSDGAAVATGDVLYYEAQGSTLIAKKNTVSFAGSPVTDSSIASGDWGVWGTRSGGGATSMNAWRAGDFSGGGTTYNESVSEAATAAMTLANDGTLGNALAEAGTAAMTLSHIATVANGLQESLSAADALVAGLLVVDGVTEAASAGDSVSNSNNALNTLSEGGAAADALANTGVLNNSLSEAGAAADSVANDPPAGGASDSDFIIRQRRRRY